MIKSLEGVEDDSENRAMRQVPSGNTNNIGNVLWVSEDGVMRRRYYNPWNKSWQWGDILDYIFNDEFELCGNIDYKKETLDRIIAYAWLRRRTPVVGRLGKRIVEDDTVAFNLRWEDEDESSSGEEDTEEEEWKRLIWSQNGILCDDRYQISNKLRIRTPKDEILKGNFFKSVGKFCAVKGIGLINLHHAFKNVTIPKVPPKIRIAAQALLTGYTPKEFSKEEMIQETTAWTYFCKAIQILDPSDALEWGTKFLDVHIYNSVKELETENSALLGEKLSVISDALCIPSSQTPQLRFIITCLKCKKITNELYQEY